MNNAETQRDNRIIVFSGNVGAGKSTVARLLTERFGGEHLRTQDFLKRLAPNLQQERRTLQLFGERLDQQTKGTWVRDGLDQAVRRAEPGSLVIVDSVRIEAQVEAIRAGYGQQVVHVHLRAELAELARRYRQRKESRLKELVSYAAVRRNKTEKRIDELGKIADIVVHTDRCTPQDVLVRVASQIGLYGRENIRLVDVLVGAAYGSEGKGQIAAYLAPEYRFAGSSRRTKRWPFSL